MFKVTKQIRFSYGHRLLNYNGKCRFLHGHNAIVEMELSKEKLDHRGMVMDFEDVKQGIQKWIDETLDHKMILNETDSIIPILQKLNEPLVLLKGNPTAENLARFIFDYAQSKGFPVTEVRFWETPSSFATYHSSLTPGTEPQVPSRRSS